MIEENRDALHDKDVFQLERVALFSDAVFAIAITLLIIEIKVPDIAESRVTDAALWQGLANIIPPFIGFVVSFFVISLYWMSHHRMFRYVHRYNQKLLWLNSVFLLTIVVMPFSTALYSQYFRPTLHVPIIIYAINISLTGLYSYRLWQLVGNPKQNVGAGLHPVILRYNSVRALVVPGLFVTVAALSYLSNPIAYIVPPLMPVVSRLIKRHYYKKYPDIMKSHG